MMRIGKRPLARALLAVAIGVGLFVFPYAGFLAVFLALPVLAYVFRNG